MFDDVNDVDVLLVEAIEKVHNQSPFIDWCIYIA